MRLHEELNLVKSRLGHIIEHCICRPSPRSSGPHGPRCLHVQLALVQLLLLLITVELFLQGGLD